MKQKIKHIAILLFSVMLIACNNNPKENNKSKDKSASLTSSNDTTIVIATVNDGVASFVADSSTLRNDWQNFISNLPDLEPCELNHIQIVSDEGSTKYYLVVSGTMNNQPLKATIELEQGAPTCLIVSGLTVSCVTTDCSSEPECIPFGVTCTPCSNGGKCTKTVTSSPVVIFPSVATGDCSN